MLELENQLQKERQKLGELRKKHYELAGVAEGWEEDGEYCGCCRRAHCCVLLPLSHAIKPRDLGVAGPSGRAHCPQPLTAHLLPRHRLASAAGAASSRDPFGQPGPSLVQPFSEDTQ